MAAHPMWQLIGQSYNSELGMQKQRLLRDHRPQDLFTTSSAVTPNAPCDWAAYIQIVALITVCSVAGVAIRIVFVFAWNYYVGDLSTAIPRDILSNSVGCFIMGFLAIKQAYLEDGTKPSPWGIAMSIGFCGSLTTFSGWESHVGSLMTTPRVLEGIACWIIGWAVPVLCYQSGRHLKAYEIFKRNLKRVSRQSHVITKRRVTIIALLCFSVYIAICVGALYALSDAKNDDAKEFLVPMAIGPYGALLRWCVSKGAAKFISWAPKDKRVIAKQLLKEGELQGEDFAPLAHMEFTAREKVALLWKYIGIPWHTMLCNTLACILYATFSPAQHRNPESSLAYQLSWGLTAGFCGCLSTVSTMVNESIGGNMPMSRAYPYITGTMILGVIPFIIGNLATQSTPSSGSMASALNISSVIMSA